MPSMELIGEILAAATIIIFVILFLGGSVIVIFDDLTCLALGVRDEDLDDFEETEAA